MNWTVDEKKKIIEWIDENYLDKHNFGSVSKSDFELFIFSTYLEHLIKSGENFDDYTVGKQLGLTISRVRSLKEKKELKYHMEDYFWVDSFLEYLKNARYDRETRLVKITIPDVNVLKDLRYFIESRGGYDEYQLNPKLFQCPIEIFVDLCNNLPNKDGSSFPIELNGEAKFKLEKLAENLPRDEKETIKTILAGDLKNGIKNLAKAAKEDLLSIVLSHLPFANTAKTAIDILLAKIKASSK